MARSDFTFFHPLRVRYAEVDMQGVVYNAHYLTYFDAAINEYFRALPYDYMNQVQRTGTDFRTVRTLVEYQGPIRFDQEIEVGVRIGRLGRSSLTLNLEIYAKSGDELLGSGEVVWVNVDKKSDRAAPLPDTLIARLNDSKRMHLEPG